jgi:hypothetical protein
MSNSLTSAMRISPRKLTRLVALTLEAGLVPFIAGSPGTGKSTLTHQLTKAGNLKLIDHRLSTSDPCDLSGLPHLVNGEAHFAPFAGLFPIEGMSVIPEGYNGWLLFLDEFNSADRDIQKAAFKLVLDRKVGQYNLHPNVHIVCAGNLITDRAITTELSTAMQSRLIHLELAVDFKEWLEDVAIANNYDQRIIAFLSRHQDKLMSFDPSHNDKTFCCPRTWSFTNDLLKVCGNDKKLDPELTPMFAGTISAGVAVEFVQFTAVYDQLPSMKDILAGNALVPTGLDLRWATISMMASNLEPSKKEDIGRLVNYANQFDVSLRVLFYRMALGRFPNLRREPVFSTALLTLQEYM